MIIKQTTNILYRALIGRELDHGIDKFRIFWGPYWVHFSKGYQHDVTLMTALSPIGIERILRLLSLDSILFDAQFKIDVQN